MRISLVLRASALALALVGWMAAPALAAPTVLSTNPEAGAEMHEPPGDVTVEFSEPLQANSGMEVIDECGLTVSDGKARIVGPAMNQLNVLLGDAPHAGTYTVKYVATGVTGTTTDSYEFIVHGGTNCDGSAGGHEGHGGMHMGGHGGHGGSGDHSGHGGGGSHDGHSGGGMHMDHSGMSGHGSGSGAHSSMGHMDMSGGHMKHMNMNHKKNGMKNMKHMNHGTGKGNNGNGNGNGNVQAAGGNPISTELPAGSSVVLALGLAVLMGLLGGWVLRVSSPS
jgi:methionine-rich copper-binding protein CopC